MCNREAGIELSSLLLLVSSLDDDELPLPEEDESDDELPNPEGFGDDPLLPLLLLLLVSLLLLLILLASLVGDAFLSGRRPNPTSNPSSSAPVNSVESSYVPLSGIFNSSIGDESESLLFILRGVAEVDSTFFSGTLPSSFCLSLPSSSFSPLVVYDSHEY